jgi:hypothetical protein
MEQNYRVYGGAAGKERAGFEQGKVDRHVVMNRAHDTLLSATFAVRTCLLTGSIRPFP